MLMGERVFTEQIKVHRKPPLRQPAIGFVDVNFATGEKFERAEPRVRRRLFGKAQLSEKRIEAGPCRGIAHTKMPFQLFHVSARREENAQDLTIVPGQRAELARLKGTGELRAATGATEAGQRQFAAADRAITWRGAKAIRHWLALTLTEPMLLLITRDAVPSPSTTCWARRPPVTLIPFGSSIFPIVACALIRTLLPLSS